jgi:DNA-binding CsgD family transcriptional regulator/DNA-binding transcriptional ArsR family regulator
MKPPKPIDADAPGSAELLRDYAALRTWEALRTMRSVVTAAELAAATRLDPRLLQRQLDLLERHGLVQAVRARKPRRATGYRVATDRIVVTFDDRDPAAAARAIERSDEVGREFARCLKLYGDPEFHAKGGFRFRMRVIRHFTPDDLAELRRRMLAVVDFLMTAGTEPARRKRSPDRAPARPAFCNQAIAIELEPLVGELLPLPSVWVTPRSKLAKSGDAPAGKPGLRGLAPREREVAIELADGLSRKHVAERLGVSVHTVSTIARRIYRKLSVTSQAGLAARLAGAARKELGER